MKTVKIFDNGKEVFSSDLDKVSAQTLESHKQETKKPEREIRHGDLGFCTFPISPPATRLFIKRDHKIVACNSRGVVTHPDMNESPPDYTLLGINIFDLMAKAMKGETTFEIATTHAGGRYSGKVEGALCASGNAINLNASLCWRTFELDDIQELAVNLLGLAIKARMEA